MKSTPSSPRLVAWEITRNCNLSCVHCRASATMGPYTGELDTASCFNLIDQIKEVGDPIIILTGGEPLLRPDIFEIAAYGTEKGLKMVMAVNGTLIDENTADMMAKAGIRRISVSIDGANKESHDMFRQVDGAFRAAIEGIRIASARGMEFQVNTTITRANKDEIPEIMKLAESLGAVAHHIFLLVPTGRGKYILDQTISASEYEDTLNWFYDQKKRIKLQLKATCAPHYYRILRQRAKEEKIKLSFRTHGLDAVTRGCLAGTGFCFISHRGRVQPCGFLDIECGNITRQSFVDVWHDSEVFKDLRDFSKLKGKCGSCEYRAVCGGCRARAHEATGDFLAEEPLCSYAPSGPAPERPPLQ